MPCKHSLLIIFLNKCKLICLHTVKWFQVFLCITNNSINPPSFVCTQLNDQTVLFQTIQFSISHSFAHSLNVKRFYLTHRNLSGAITPGPKWTWKQWQWTGILHSPKLLLCWTLTIRLFNVISRTLVGGVLPLCRYAFGVFYCPRWPGYILMSWLVGWLVGFYGISTFIGYIMPNPIFYNSVLF